MKISFSSGLGLDRIVKYLVRHGNQVVSWVLCKYANQEIKVGSQNPGDASLEVVIFKL